MPKAGVITIDVDAGTAKMVLALDAANARLGKFGDSARAAGGHAVSSMQASSAAIRLVEGDITRNIRAVERFITTIPGVGKALQLAFPLVGGLAFLGLVGKIADSLGQLIEKFQGAQEKLSGAFEGINRPLQQTNDELTFSNVKLQNEIAKLENRPANALAEALAQAAVNADRLVGSLTRVSQEAFKALSENKTPWYKFWESGQSGLLQQEGGFTGTGGFNGRLADLGGDPTKSAVALNQELNVLKGQLGTLQSRMSEESAGGLDPSEGAKKQVEYLQDFIRLRQQQLNQVYQTTGNSQLEGIKNKDQAGKDAQEAAKREVELEQQTLKQAYERMLADQEKYEQLGAHEKAAFLEDELAYVQKFGGRYKELETELQTELAHARQEDYAQAKAARDKDAADEKHYQEELFAAQEEWVRRTIDLQKTINKSNADTGPHESRPDIEQMPIPIPLNTRLQMGGTGGAIAASGLGDPLAAAKQQIDLDQKQLELMQAAHAPLSDQLALRLKIAEAQEGLDVRRGGNTQVDQMEAANLKLQQTLAQWKQVGVGTIVGDVDEAYTQIPGALGGSLASGLLGGKKGEDVGKQVESAMKNIGVHLLGNIFTQMIEKMMATTVAQFGLNMLNNWAIHYATNPFGLLASGTDSWHGGAAVIGEKGPELVNLPRGAQVIPHDRTLSILRNSSRTAQLVASQRGGGDTHNYGGSHTFNIYEASDARETARHITDFIKSSGPGFAVASSN